MAIFNSYVKLPEGTVAPSEFCGPKHPPQPGRRSKRYCFRSHSSPPVASLSSLGGGKCHEKPHCDLKRNNWKGHSYHVLSRILRKCIFLSFLLGTIHLYVLWHWWFDKPPIYGNVADGVLLGCQRYETIPIGLMLGNFSGNFLMVICYTMFFSAPFFLNWKNTMKHTWKADETWWNRKLWGSTCFNLFPDLSDSSDQSKSASTKLPWGCKGNSNSSTWVIITCIEPESITPGISHQPGFWYSNVMMLLMLICGTYVAPHM